MSALTPVQEQTLTIANDLCIWASAVIDQVPTQTDERLIALAIDAKDLETSGFRIRTAIGLELKERHKLDGKGLSRLAKEIGIAPKTFEDDLRIGKKFPEVITGQTPLGREFYRRALAAPDPHAAIEMAEAKKAENGSYSVNNFQADVWALQGGKPIKEVDETAWVNERLESPEAVAAWAKLTGHFASNSEALSAAVIKLAGEL